MADKTPVRVVFNASNVATGLAEFQSGETVPVSNGGTGISSIGSAGQVLKVNQAGDALVFAGEGDLSIQNLVAPSNADLSLRTSGTGSIILNDLTIADNSISTNRSNDDLFINASGSGTVTLENLKVGTGGATVTTILDEDAMGSDSATSLATQQSIKAYVDSEVGAVSTTAISQLNSNVTVADSGSGTITVTVDASTIGTFTSSGLQLGGSGARVTTVLDEDGFDSNSNTSLATQQSIKAYVDAQITAEDLDFQADSGGALSIDLDSETFTFTGGTGIDTSGSGNAVTFAIDSTVATLTGSQTLTNKILTSPTINSPTIATPTITGATTIGEITTNSITSNGSNADISIQPSGTGDVLLSGLRVNGTTLDSSDSTKITMAENVDVTGTLAVAGALSSSTSLALASGATVTGIADEDNMSSNSATLLATQQSIKAFVESGSITLSNKTIASPTITTPTVVGTATIGTVATTTITSNGSNADLDMSPAGSGKVQFYGAYTFPTSDGSNGNALVTDGSGALSFGTVGDPSASDLTDSVTRKDKRLYINRARAIDKFDVTFCDSVLYYVCTNDYKNDIVNIQKLSVVHNNSSAFISGVGINNSAAIDMPVFTADVSGSLVVVKGEMTSDDSSIDAIGGSTTFLKLPLGDNSSAGSSGNTQLIVNSDVDSASEAFDTFAHASFRGAKYFFSVNNDTKTEVENIEVLVVHDGSDAYMTQYAGVSTGNDPLMTVTAAISGSNVVVSVAGLEPNLRVTANIIRLKDTMVSDSGTFANTEAIAPTTISSTATAIVDLDTVSKGNGAVIYVVGKNATEGAFSISEVFMAVSGSGDISITSPGHVSTKSTDQLEFSTGFKDDEEATAQLLASSTSGGSTTCSAYRINLLAN